MAEPSNPQQQGQVPPVQPEGINVENNHQPGEPVVNLLSNANNNNNNNNGNQQQPVRKVLTSITS